MIEKSHVIAVFVGVLIGFFCAWNKYIDEQLDETQKNIRFIEVVKKECRK